MLLRQKVAVAPAENSLLLLSHVGNELREEALVIVNPCGLPLNVLEGHKTVFVKMFATKAALYAHTFASLECLIRPFALSFCFALRSALTFATTLR